MKFSLYGDINYNVELFKESSGVLLDVRTRKEYADGHIPNSILLPLDELDRIGEIIPDTSTEIFAYCRSGNRSGKAEAILKYMGYKNARNIGGIIDYKGVIEK